MQLMDVYRSHAAGLLCMLVSNSEPLDIETRVVRKQATTLLS